MLDRLSFRFCNKLPLILQTEATECGLACLGMVAAYHGYRTDMITLRQQFSLSLKGMVLSSLVRIAKQLDLTTRPLKLSLNELSRLRLPCILHWDFNHFVVLKKVSTKSVTIHDPAVGVQKLTLEKVSEHFTGVALELWPNTSFEQKEQKQAIRLVNMLGRVVGLYRSFGQVLALALALEVFALVGPLFLQWTVDEVLVSADRDLLTTLAIGFGMLMLMQQAITAVRGWVLLFMSTTLGIQWRANVFSHLLQLPIAYFEKRHLGDVVSRFGSIDAIQKTLTNSFVEAILDGLMAVATLVLMVIYSPTLAFIAMVSMSLYGAIRLCKFRPVRIAAEEQIVHAAKQQGHFLETIRGAKTIKLFQRQDERRSSWLCLLVAQVNAELHTEKLALLFHTLNGLIFGTANIAIIWFGAKLVLNGNFTVGVFIAFHAYKSQFDTRVASLIDKFFEVKLLQLQGERLADIVLTKPESEQISEISKSEFSSDLTIEVRDLQFRYANHEPLVLDGVTFKIFPGESVAITGPSGGGKTTLINILLGILDPTAGEILIGGVPFKQFGKEAIREMVGTVLQDDVLFAGSISDNISFFNFPVSFERVKECAQFAAIDVDINAMPMGYNTLVGDMGTVLSGGQKQRVLLARALYKKPTMLFLDEATSHLDIEHEKIVNNSIKSLKMTRILVAHRPETIATADRVLLLDNGKIVDNAGVQ